MKVTIELKPSKIGGIGVFAVKPIKVYEKIGEYVNREDRKNFIKWKDFEPNVDIDIDYKIEQFCLLLKHGFIAHDNFDKMEVLDYINHSCDPNTFINDVGDLISSKLIRKGYELTVDYSSVNTDSEWTMRCNCNSKNCRHEIIGGSKKSVIPLILGLD